MSSETVWLKEVFEALEDRIKKNVKYRYLNEEGEEVVVDIPVFVRKPDEDFQVEVFPSITLYSSGYTRNELRYNRNAINVVSRNPENNTMILEESAIPYDLNIQIDFWTTYANDMDSMIIQWLSSYPQGFINLPVQDKSNNLRNSFMRQRGGVIKSDRISDNERIFHSIINYIVWVEIDEKIQVEKPMITSVTIE